MNQIEIYTSQTCPYCIKAKKLLKMLNLEYVELDVSESFGNMCEELPKRFDRSISTVPQIIINDKYVGGYTDLEALHKSGRLNEYLN